MKVDRAGERKEREVESEKKMKQKGLMEIRGETMEHKGKKKTNEE